MSFGYPPAIPTGGPPPAPIITSLSPNAASPGTVIVVAGQNFFPGTTFRLEPGNIPLGIVVPTQPTTFIFTLPLGLAGFPLRVYANNGQDSNGVVLGVLVAAYVQGASSTSGSLTLGTYR